MAVIKIKNIRTNLQAVIKYAKNGDKTDFGILVSSINCSVENSYEEMALTKKFFHKEDKILGYHIIQSFKGNEVSPEEANQIGNELAEELWGDKYHNSKAEIAFMKDASDRLCLNYGLSIVNTSKGNNEKEFRQKNIDYFNRRDEKMQKIINDIDEAVKLSKSYSDFKLVLKSKGYEKINDYGKYFSMKTPYFQRNVRIDRVFGEKYSVEGIKERIYGYIKEDLPPVANLKEKYYKKVYTGPKINKLLLQTSSFYRTYVHYLYAFNILPAKNEYIELTPEYYKQKKKNNMIFEELNFLSRHRFKSINEIKDYKVNFESQLPKLKGKREDLWRKYHKTTNENDKITIKNEINKLTEEIDTITAQRNACNRIIDRYSVIQEDDLVKLKNKEKLNGLIIKNKYDRNK